MLATTADDYFAPSLTTLSEWLGLRERVAGLTFLALGNGAADMFSVIAAVRVGATDLAVGALQGGSMCVTCVVTAGVLMAVRGGEVKASGVFFTDLFVNIISCIVIMVILSALPIRSPNLFVAVSRLTLPPAGAIREHALDRPRQADGWLLAARAQCEGVHDVLGGVGPAGALLPLRLWRLARRPRL